MQFLIYVAVLLVTAASLALGLDVMTRPDAPAKTATHQQAATASAAPAKTVAADTKAGNAPVRQIPIVADAGDPKGALSPVYPAAPGKDLPVTDTVVAAAPQPTTATTGPAPTQPQPTTAPSTTGMATPAPTTSTQPPQLQASYQSAAPTAGPACNVAACAAAYRSFRESDCTYQPYGGPRAVCSTPPDTAAQSAAIQPPPSPQQQAPTSQQARRIQVQSADSRYEDELRAAAQAVRRLPRSTATYEYDDGDEPVMRSQSMRRYGLRRNWIVEGE